MITSEEVRNAFRTVVDKRVSEKKPEVHVDNRVEPTPITVEAPQVHVDAPVTVEATQVHIDMKPVARSLAILIKGLREMEDRFEKGNAANLKVMKEIAEQNERQIAMYAEMVKLLKENRNSKLIGKIDSDTGNITVERVNKGV